MFCLSVAAHSEVPLLSFSVQSGSKRPRKVRITVNGVFLPFPAPPLPPPPLPLFSTAEGLIISNGRKYFHLLQKFTHLAAKVEDAPHPLANWYVITNLSKELLGVEWPENPSVWNEFSVEDIRIAAKKLLNLHNQALVKEGAKTTAGIIKP